MLYFVKVRNDQGNLYDSYTDYWSLVNLSTFHTCELEDVDPASDHTYVFSPENGNVRAKVEGTHQAKYILWQLERPGPVRPEVPAWADEMWVSDLYFHELVADRRCKFVPLGGHPRLGGYLSFDKQYDFAHMAYIHGRREQIVNWLQGRGFTFAPVGWGAARDVALASSRFGLCLHQDDLPILEPQRYTLFACWGLPLITEFIRAPWPYRTIRIDNFKNNPLEFYRDHIEANRRALTEELTFRRCVESVL